MLQTRLKYIKMVIFSTLPLNWYTVFQEIEGYTVFQDSRQHCLIIGEEVEGTPNNCYKLSKTS